MTSSTSMPAASSRAATVRACHSASWLPRVPMRSGECISRGGAAIRVLVAALGGAAPRRQPEQPVQRVRIGRDERLVADRLQLFGRRQQQLLDDQPGDLVDAGARLGRQPGELRLEPCQLRLADRLEPLAQRHHGRDDLARLQPGANFAASSPTIASARSSSLDAPRQVLLDDPLQVVDVVEEDLLELADGRLDVARHGDVDDEERPLAARPHHLARRRRA